MTPAILLGTLLSSSAYAWPLGGEPYLTVMGTWTLGKDGGPGLGVEGGYHVITSRSVVAGPFAQARVGVGREPTLVLGGRGGYAFETRYTYFPWGYLPNRELEVQAGLAVNALTDVGVSVAVRPGIFGVDSTIGLERTTTAEHPDGLWDPIVTLGLSLPLLVPLPVVVGRLLRQGDQAHFPRVLARRGDPRGHTWLRRAQEEHASIGAFVRLAAELSALGAPPALIGRALQAADDERAHARLSYGRAAELLGPVTVAPLPPVRRPLGDRQVALTRLAVEGLVDGVVGEGQAARDAIRDRDAARDEGEARIEARIAAEEAQHAALGGDLVVWACREGGRAVRGAVDAAAC